LADQDSSNDPGTRSVISPRPGWLIQGIKHKFHERRTKNNQQNSVDRAATSTARATWAIAVLTAVTIGVGWSQYRIFDRQLTVMQDQLKEMKSSGTQTDSLIETNKKLAEAASVQAQAAKDAAITAHDNLIASQRAWISPTNFSLVAVTDARHPLQVQMTYQNVGREPARNIRNNMIYGYIRNPIPQEPFSWGGNPVWGTIDGISPKRMCESVSSSVNSVAYPTPNTSFTLEINDRDDPLHGCRRPSPF
jgi:hypothetical protein